MQLAYYQALPISDVFAFSFSYKTFTNHHSGQFSAPRNALSHTDYFTFSKSEMNAQRDFITEKKDNYLKQLKERLGKKGTEWNGMNLE